MKLKRYKPTTNGVRHKRSLEKALLSKSNSFLKFGSYRKISRGGRSSINGKITVWHRGNLKKRKKFRILDFSNRELNAVIISTHYDSFRSSLIGVCFDFKRKEFRRFLLSKYLYPGCLLMTGDVLNEYRIGYRSSLSQIPPGSVVNNIISSGTNISTYARSAGASGVIVQKDLNIVKIRLISGKVLTLSSSNFATIGSLSNPDHNRVVLGKAGKSRLKGRRPVVRGVAMNPVDHPHGGRTNGGRPSVSPWGILTKGGFKL